jgi:hypothetical protein
MSQLKRAWITPHDAGLVALSLESASADIDYRRVRADEKLYPTRPTPAHPLRHVVAIRLLDTEDLLLLRLAIDDYLSA